MSSKTSHLLFFFFTFLFLSSLLLSPCTASDEHSKGETENEKEFTYLEESEHGPKDWGKIHKDWGTCDNGDTQSPIDLTAGRVEVMPQLGKLHMEYTPSDAIAINRGHDIMLKWKGNAGHITIEGTEYSLKQCHWHAPAEHTFNGTRHAMELHMVHQTPDGQIAVVGITYKIGKPDKFLAKIMPSIGTVGDEGKDVGYINPKKIKLGHEDYYRYIGSLTVPPCTEGVTWTVLKRVRTVSEEQVMQMKASVDDHAESNARPVQEHNDRIVWLYAGNSASA